VIGQLEKEKDELNKTMEEKEQLDLKEKSNFNCLSRCIVFFPLLELQFVLKYSTMWPSLLEPYGACMATFVSDDLLM